MSQEDIVWVSETGDNNFYILASCGKWQAELAIDEPYTPGLVFIKPKENSNSFPKKLGDGNIDNLDSPSIFCLIHEIAIRMRKHLMCAVHGNKCTCKNVYLLSLNEGDSPLHFRLWPRYDHDAYLMELVDETGEEADAIALMAERRHQFLLRHSTNRWSNWPPSRDSNGEAWRQYALHIKEMLVPKTEGKVTEAK